ncbi:MAG: sigma-70 family RNA polymerase sigma factor [Sterolibacteriaceae bacterium]|nr:sigma-70 family RNA polymerase sigma factor [Sterolibacteriaceae bacterium]MBK9087420.1 sigma-70 family RNA polymerase sigma factor [Sterolibacteriaceae bacterium]
MRQSIGSYLFAGAFAPVVSLDELIAQHAANGGPSFDIPDESPGADAQLEQAQAIAAVEHFVSALSPRDQEIVKRLFWQDETQTQIAASFGVSKMAISKAVARIYKQGRAALALHQHLAYIN